MARPIPELDTLLPSLQSLLLTSPEGFAHVLEQANLPEPAVLVLVSFLAFAVAALRRRVWLSPALARSAGQQKPVLPSRRPNLKPLFPAT